MIRARLERLEWEEAAARKGSQSNVFDAVLQLVLGDITLDDVDPEDRSIVEQLYRASTGGGSASASPLGSASSRMADT
jgi:hypothetical protein